MKEFKYVSLFSGIGGFEQALNKLGGNCVMASEIDRFANQSYEILYGHPTAGDVTKVAAEDVPDHDLLVGGFPCQAFSVAGKRLGFDDTRGTLFFEIARIAKVKQPRALLLENVKGLISHDKGKTLDTIIQTLHDIGYTVDFNVMNSKYFGVPQNRERIFIVAVRNDLVTPDQWNVGKRTDVVAKGKRRISEMGVSTFNFDWPAQEEVTVRLRDILEIDVDERFYLSEEKTAKLVAQLDERVEGLAIREATKKGYVIAQEGDAVNFQFPDSESRRGRLGKEIANTLEASNINQGVVEPVMLGHIDLKGHDAIKRGYSSDGVSPTLTTMGGGHREPKIAVVASLEYYGNDQMNRVHSVEGLSPTVTSRNSGNEPKIAEPLGVMFTQKEILRDVSISNTLQAAGPSRGLGNNNPITGVVEYAPRYRIRKLTPRECFRLQGFPDSEFDKLTANGISNSQLYKQAGNAVTVNVIDAIGRRLLDYVNKEEKQ